MVKLSLDISQVPSKKIDILLERIPYLSEVITGLSYDSKDKVIHMETNVDDQSLPQIKELYESFDNLTKSLEDMRVIKSRVIKSNENLEINRLTLTNEEKIDVHLNESEVTLMDWLDKIFIQIAKRHGAELREYPTVLSKNNMSRNQYHIHFPQNIYVVSSVPHNYKAINDFRQNALNNSLDRSFSFKGDVLQPCICYHCYEELQGESLASRKVFTGKGKCFRHEIGWRKDRFRQNEFTMREIVFVGDEQWVIKIRNQIMDDVWSLFKKIGLTGKIETATDPFFFSQDLKTKGTYQMMSDAKYELIVTTRKGKNSSIASFNYCQDMLCKKYEIKDQNEVALYSGCVAFGINRWKEAFIDVYGDDITLWPEFSLEKEILF